MFRSSSSFSTMGSEREFSHLAHQCQIEASLRQAKAEAKADAEAVAEAGSEGEGEGETECDARKLPKMCGQHCACAK